MSKGSFGLLFDAYRARKQGLQAVEQRQRVRLAEIVAYARANSPYYRELYRHLPEHVENPGLLPVSSKTDLMARFDDWATDRKVTIDKARPFADNPKLIGERFLDKYTLATTSGTTGTPGIFVIDDHAMRVTSALMFRMLSAGCRAS